MNAAVYEKLLARLKRIQVLATVSGHLGWDEQVYLPPGSAPLRGQQSALMAELVHREASHPEIGEMLSAVEATPAELTADQLAVVRQARRDYDQATKLPADFVREKAEHTSRGYHAWVSARSRSDFGSFAPFLVKHLELARREAGYMGCGARPYDYWIDQHDPGVDSQNIAQLFAGLKEGLVPLVRQIAASGVRSRREALCRCPVYDQRELLYELIERLGFDFQRGRLDVSLHPFCSGSGMDTRMTTRFNADAPLDSLFGAIHETGHGMYEQGLVVDYHGTALGMNAGMAWHESQSRLWENQVARSRAFWQYFEPRFRSRFTEQASVLDSDELYLAVNTVRPGCIRVEADEVTYNLHIILRFEMERRMFAGDLAVDDLPQAWNDGMQELLGLRPPDDRRGVLQDIHWSGGSFGYFPSYCLGNMIAAQLWDTVRRSEAGLEDDFSRGDFSRLLRWLRANVHHRGRRMGTLEMVKAVTDQELSPRPLLDYLRERYGSLYLQ